MSTAANVPLNTSDDSTKKNLQRQTQKVKHKFSTKFAINVGKTEPKYLGFTATLILRHASDGTLYLHDMIEIKRDKAIARSIEAQGRNKAAANDLDEISIADGENKVKQNFSTVNSTQLALENPDVYDEIHVTYDEILQKTKGKDLETALLEEARKHSEDIQMWEHEAAALTKLWKQSEKNEAKHAKALSERRDRIAEVSDELKDAWDESHREYMKMYDWV